MNTAMASAYRPEPNQRIVAVEGYPFMGMALAASLAALTVGHVDVALGGLMAAAGIAAFFRNPERAIPTGKGVVVSPADGRVVAIRHGEVMPHVGKPAQRVSIFLSLFNVHINRAPISGRVRQVEYTSGKFFLANNDKATTQNERNVLVLESEDRREVVMAQIAGFVARRIVCYRRAGDMTERGERLGLIRFGSRVDLYLPPDCALAVRVGDKIKGGQSIIGRLP